MSVTKNTKKVYPTRLDLEQECQTNVSCSVAGCSQVFQQPSALRLHLVKSHSIIKNDSDARLAKLLPSEAVELQYHCPESTCRFSSKEFFKTYGHLKQHYLRIHGPKSHVCTLCGKSVGFNPDLQRHVKSCSKRPWCISCKICLGSMEILARHLKETGHEALESQSSELAAADQSNLKTVKPKVIRPVSSSVSRILPLTDCLITGECKCDMSACPTRALKSFGTARQSVFSSTQTQKVEVAKTQTKEGFGLQKTLGTYNLPLFRQVASQVFPRVTVRHQFPFPIHAETSVTFTLNQKRSVSVQTAASSEVPSVPPSNVWSKFVHKETQTTALLQQLPAALAETRSTQTLESHLFDNCPNGNCIGTPSNEASANPCSMQPGSVGATNTAEGSNLFSSVALSIKEEPLKQDTTSENISNAIKSEYGQFSSQVPNIVVGEQNRSSCFLMHDEMFVKSEFPAPATSTTARCNDDLLTPQKTFTK